MLRSFIFILPYVFCCISAYDGKQSAIKVLTVYLFVLLQNTHMEFLGSKLPQTKTPAWQKICK